MPADEILRYHRPIEHNSMHIYNNHLLNQKKLLLESIEEIKNPLTDFTSRYFAVGYIQSIAEKDPDIITEDVINVLAILLKNEKFAHERNMLVVYIQHENQTTIKFDSEPWKLHKELSPNENDIRIRKKENNAFFETDLNTMLKENSITKLFICGLLSNLCVYNTCLGALEFKYETILISDGHSNVSKNPEEKKSQINKKLEKVGVKCITTNDFIGNSI